MRRIEGWDVKEEEEDDEDDVFFVRRFGLDMTRRLRWDVYVCE